jgi:hypothetical protein
MDFQVPQYRPLGNRAQTRGHASLLGGRVIFFQITTIQTFPVPSMYGTPPWDTRKCP